MVVQLIAFDPIPAKHHSWRTPATPPGDPPSLGMRQLTERFWPLSSPTRAGQVGAANQLDLRGPWGFSNAGSSERPSGGAFLGGGLIRFDAGGGDVESL